MRCTLRVLFAATVAAAPAWAGVDFTVATRTEGGKGAGMGDTVVKVAAEGEQARINWEETQNPMFAKGTYMLVNPKGGMTFVNPAKKTYSKFDLAAMMEGLDQMAGGAAQFGFKMEVQDVKVEKLLEEAGAEILGYPTTHYRWHTSWTMVMRMPKPMKDRSMENDSVEDDWTTTALGLRPTTAKAFEGMMQGQMTGELRKLTETAKATMTGFVLKKISVTKGSGGRGSQTTTMEVKELRKADIPPSTFVIPPDYSETDMMQPQRGPAMPNLNQP